jgi:chorismate dehydratase
MSLVSVTTALIKPRTAIRLGSVSYLNAKPLIYGLEEADDLRLTLDVPSRLIDGLREHRFDVALLPVIDYQKLPGLKILLAGGIGSDGPTLTVRIFSRAPISKISVLACDTDSHTSVALARIVLAEMFGLHPRFIDLNAADANPAEARLLIGDKVVCEEPVGFEHQLDLGQAWKELTGLPFVFAVWMARGGVDLGDLPQRLELAKQRGLEHVREIVERYAIPRGWPLELAIQYLTENLQFNIGPRQLHAIRHFHQLAAKHGIITESPRELEMLPNLEGS